MTSFDFEAWLRSKRENPYYLVMSTMFAVVVGALATWTYQILLSAEPSQATFSAQSGQTLTASGTAFMERPGFHVGSITWVPRSPGWLAECIARGSAEASADSCGLQS